MHIVFLDNPLPADYGGAIDMYFKAKALKKLGYSLTLHVFEYGRVKQDSLNELGKFSIIKESDPFFRFSLPCLLLLNLENPNN